MTSFCDPVNNAWRIDGPLSEQFAKEIKIKDDDDEIDNSNTSLDEIDDGKEKVTPSSSPVITKNGDNDEESEEPRVEKVISETSSSSHNGESERSDSPVSSSSATLSSSLSATSSNNINGELALNDGNGDDQQQNADTIETNETNENNKDKCKENPESASQVKNDYDVIEGPFCGQLNGNSNEDPVIIYQFELAQYLCGRLIGRTGHYVNQIKANTNASVIVNRHPLTPLYKICSIEGTRSEIRRALRLIRSRFPIYEFPEVTLQQINVISPLLQACQVTVPQSCQLHLPEGVSCDVILSNVVNAGHIFVRQPTHPTYPSLIRLDQFMNATYSVETPPVLSPNPGDICAVNMCSGWYRAMVVNVWDDLDVEVKFVDYGGYARAPISSLRQIRYDFMTLPFQASECYLANVKPIDEDQGWSKEANVVFHDLAQGQMLQAKIVAYADDGIPLIHLHKIQGASNIFINQELVNRGLAQWVEHQMWE